MLPTVPHVATQRLFEAKVIQQTDCDMERSLAITQKQMEVEYENDGNVSTTNHEPTV